MDSRQQGMGKTNVPDVGRFDACTYAPQSSSGHSHLGLQVSGITKSSITETNVCAGTVSVTLTVTGNTWVTKESM